MIDPRNYFAPQIGPPGLQIFIETGVALVNGSGVLIPGSLVALIPNATNFIYLSTTAAAIVTNTSGFPLTNCYPIAVTITGNTSVTSLIDARADVGGGGGGGTWDTIGNAASNLTLNNAGFSTTFNQTSAVPWTWANTTAAATASGVVTPALIASGVTSLNSGGSGNSVTLNTTGATLLAFVVTANTPSITVKDSFGNAWNFASITGESGGILTQVAYAYANASGGPLVIGSGHVITCSGGAASVGTALAFSGTKTTSAVLGSVTAAGANNLSSPFASCTISSPSVGDILISAFGVNQVATSPTISANGDGNTWATPVGNGSDAVVYSVFASYAIAASTTSSNPQWTRSGVTQANEVMISFHAASAATPQNSPVLALAGTAYGASSEPDQWNYQVVEGSTVNGTSTLTLTQSGSTGFASVSVPNLSVTGQVVAGNVYTTGTASAATLLSGTGTFSGQVTIPLGTSLVPALQLGPGSGFGLFNPGAGSAGVGIQGTVRFFSGSTDGLDISGGKIVGYNAISTVSNGVPSELATVDLTGQVAAITATTLYTPTATGMFRISAYLKITTAGTSPVLGPVTITYTDGTDSVAQSNVMGLATQAGAIATSNSGNTATSVLAGDMIIWAKTGVAIQYAVALTGTVGTGAYEIHLKCEAM